MFVGYWDGDYVSQLPYYVLYYVGVKRSFQHAREGLCVLGVCCLVCQDLVSCYFNLVLLPHEPEWGECNVISLYCMCFFVNGSVCHVCCVFVNCLVKQFAICLGVVLILLLNVMEVFSVGGGAG